MSAETLPDGCLRETITYLEMRERPPDRSAARSPKGGIVVRVRRPALGFYRRLYRAVGTPWLWKDRLLLNDRELAHIIRDPAVHIHVLFRNGRPVGFMELDCREPRDIEVAFCGLVPGHTGKGLGRLLLGRALALAWAMEPDRVWLHTSSHDHPGALDFYRGMGFRVCATEQMLMQDPRLSGVLPETAAPQVPLARRG